MVGCLREGSHHKLHKNLTWSSTRHDISFMVLHVKQAVLALKPHEQFCSTNPHTFSYVHADTHTGTLFTFLLTNQGQAHSSDGQAALSGRNRQQPEASSCVDAFQDCTGYRNDAHHHLFMTPSHYLLYLNYCPDHVFEKRRPKPTRSQRNEIVLCTRHCFQKAMSHFFFF